MLEPYVLKETRVVLRGEKGQTYPTKQAVDYCRL